MPTPFSNGLSLNGVLILAGAGAPEGAVAAPVGSRYFRSNGKEYVKISGTAATGWLEVTGIVQEVALSWTGDAAGTYRATVACTLFDPGLAAGGTPTVAYAYSSDGVAAFAAATFPIAMVAGSVFRVTLTGFNTYAAWSCVRA